MKKFLAAFMVALMITTLFVSTTVSLSASNFSTSHLMSSQQFQTTVANDIELSAVVGGDYISDACAVMNSVAAGAGLAVWAFRIAITVNPYARVAFLVAEAVCVFH